jgi:hypothetical protein
MRWLGFRSPYRTERHRGPCGPHPRAKIPEGEIEGDFVSLGAYIANQSVLPRPSSILRACHLELSREAGLSQQTSHLVFFCDGVGPVFADCDLDSEERLVNPSPEICSLPPCKWSLAPSLHRVSVARIPSRRFDCGISTNAWYRAPAVLPWSCSSLARATVEVGSAGSLAHFFRNSRGLGRTFRIQVQRESSRVVVQHRNWLYDRSLHIGRWVFRQDTPDLSILGGIRWNIVSLGCFVGRGVAGTRIAMD